MPGWAACGIRARIQSIPDGVIRRFRGYADYMQTAEFHKNLEQLMHLASEAPTAIMCAEAVPWRCHRSLIADALTARGVTVLEIMTADKTQPHAMTPFAKVEGDRSDLSRSSDAG